MTPFEIGLNVTMLAVAGGGLAFVAHVLRTSGRERQESAARVEHVMASAPYSRLDNVISK